VVLRSSHSEPLILNQNPRFSFKETKIFSTNVSFTAGMRIFFFFVYRKKSIHGRTIRWVVVSTALEANVSHKVYPKMAFVQPDEVMLMLSLFAMQFSPFLSLFNTSINFDCRNWIVLDSQEEDL